jgi:nicotinate phosphoribosyltransferase
VGVRLDSGDLAYLAVRAAGMLDEAGFPECKIVLSNQLDEAVILQVIEQIRDEADRTGADADAVIKRLSYGVGTHLVTSAGAPALDGVYKLVGLEKDGEWRPAIKVSESAVKTLNPGSKTVWRLYDRGGMATADFLCLEGEDPAREDPLVLRHPVEATTHRSVSQSSLSDMESLLVPFLEGGKITAELPDIEELRRRRDADLERLDVGVRRIINPHVYHVSLSEALWRLKQDLVERARG